MLEIILLSATQGITEFLPISSSAHLILIENFFNMKGESLTLDISLHVGSLIAIIFFFKKEIINFLKQKNFLIKIIISSLPTMMLGFILVKLNIIEYLRNIKIISVATIIFGIILYYADKSETNKKLESDISFAQIFTIGIFQMLALIPGVSRSGITITAARILKFDRNSSIKISFFLSIPILLAVSFYNMSKLIVSNNIDLTVNNLYGLLLSFIFSYLTLKYLFRYIKKFNFTIFVLYRIIIGCFLIVNMNL